jgi:hypothetical protein
MRDLLCISVLAIWMFCSVLKQLRWPPVRWFITLIDLITSADLPGILPYWSFYAPEPQSFTFSVFYRDRFRDHSVSKWSSMDSPSFTPLSFLCNPGRRRAKAMFYVCSQLMRIVIRSLRGEWDASHVYVSWPYLCIASCVSSGRHFPGATESQFLMVLNDRAASRDKPVIVFLSPMFSLEGRD